MDETIMNEALKNFLELSGVSSKDVSLYLERTQDYKDESNLMTLDNANNLFDLITDYDKLVIATKVHNYSDITPHIYVALCAKNGLNAMKRLVTYERISGPYRSKFVETTDVVKLFPTYNDGSTYRENTQFINSLILTNLLRSGSGKMIKPIEITTIFKYPKELVEYLGINPTRGASYSISFRKSDLLIDFKTQNDIIWSLIEPELNRKIENIELNYKNIISFKVYNLLLELIPLQKAKIEVVARNLDVHPRQLQRLLKNENTSFTKELTKARIFLSKKYICKSISIKEISFLLGYTSQYSFMRAFHDWTGVTVGEYRIMNTQMIQNNTINNNQW